MRRSNSCVRAHGPCSRVPANQGPRGKLDPPELKLSCSAHHHAEADEAAARGHDHLEARVAARHLLEASGQLDLPADVRLDAAGAVRAHHHPQLERAEAPAQRQLPVLRVDRAEAVSEQSLNPKLGH